MWLMGVRWLEPQRLKHGPIRHLNETRFGSATGINLALAATIDAAREPDCGAAVCVFILLFFL